MNEDAPDLLPFESLSYAGVLWAINRFLFHPMGFAFTLMVDENGVVAGWYLQGDGSECWTMPEEADDEYFERFHAFVNQFRKGDQE